MGQLGQQLRVDPSAQAVARAGVTVKLARRASRRLVNPLCNRLLSRLGVGEVSAGVLIAAALLVLFFAREALLGRLGVAVSSLPDLHVVTVESLLVGYLVAARAFTARAARAALDQRRATIEPSDGADERVGSEAGLYLRRRFDAAGLAGVALGTLAPLIVFDSTANHPWDVARMTPELLWRHGLGALIGWLLGTYVVVAIRESSRVSSAARHLEEVGLFDSESVAPFSRFALQTVFTTVGLFSVVSLMLVEHGFGLVVASLGTVTALAAAAGLLFPLRGLRDRIREEKKRELACCRAALRRARDALIEGRMVTTEHGHLAEIVNYTRLVQSVSEWPIDTPMVLRASAFVLLPIGSWLTGNLGSQVASRVVTMVLG